MATLQPAIATLGIAAPYLGPWFDDATLTLAPPDTNPAGGDLSVTLQFNIATTLWLPPARGLLSLHVSTVTRPKPLASLRKPDGSPAFNDDRLLALYTLLPEVADRLDALTRSIAPADGSAAGNAPSRARVACLALEFPDNNAAWLGAMQPPPPQGDPGDPPMSPADVAVFFGVALNADGITLGNHASPMADMRTPGKLPLIGNFEPLLLLPLAFSGLFRLHAFDQRGRPLDPGAVAAWWAALGAQFPDLWAMGLSSPLPGAANDQRTAPVAAALSGQVVNAHEGPVDDGLMARLDRDAAGISALAIDALFTRQAGAPAPMLQFTPPPSGPGVRDDAPMPRVAALPGGRYASQLTLWANAAATPLARDFVRVAVVELEEHLVGQKRIAPVQATATQSKHADDQQRWTTRVAIAQSLGPALLATVDAAAAAALAVISGNNAQVLSSSLDAGWGPLPGLPAAAAPPVFPALLPKLKPLPLLGGSADANALPKLGQRVLMQFTGLVGLANCWLRAWPVGFDLLTGQRTVLTGGAARVDNNGNASLVLELPDGAGSGQLGVRLSLTAPGGFTRDYTEQRFNRPNPVGAASAGLAWGSNGATGVLLCEQGQVLAPPLNGVILPGSTVVEVVPGGFALINPATIPANAFSALTAAAAFGVGDALALTQPAFKQMPDGAVGANGLANWQGAALNRATRNGLNPLISDSQPLASQERLDHAAASRAAHAACVWTAPALARYHELGAHNTGHAGAPAAVEVHGTGVALNGPAAHLVADHTEDRIAKNAAALVTAATAAPAVPAAPAGANLWLAVLKTVAAGVEGEQQFGEKVVSTAAPGLAYVFEPADNNGVARAYESIPPKASDIKKWYDDNFVTTQLGVDILGTRLPGSAGWPGSKIAAAKRAMDRRALEAGWGLREAMVSVGAALSRAEDFIYIETPALDQAGVGPDAEILLGRLLLRLANRPLLRVLLCLPSRLMPGWPKGVETLRNLNLHNAIGALRLIGGDRVAVFSPSAGQGRELRLTATTVIVDDAYALTGSSHLWRRGLSFDGSLAVALFDEVLSTGRPAEIVALRRALIANQLSLPPQRVPDDPAALVEMVQRYNQMRSARVGQAALTMPKLVSPPGPGWTPDDGWNPDGSVPPDASVLALLYGFLQGNQADLP